MAHYIPSNKLPSNPNLEKHPKKLGVLFIIIGLTLLLTFHLMIINYVIITFNSEITEGSIYDIEFRTIKYHYKVNNIIHYNSESFMYIYTAPSINNKIKVKYYKLNPDLSIITELEIFYKTFSVLIIILCLYFVIIGLYQLFKKK